MKTGFGVILNLSNITDMPRAKKNVSKTKMKDENNMARGPM
jgi:hypothetical protein